MSDANFCITEPLKGYNGPEMPGGHYPDPELGTPFPEAMRFLYRRMKEEGVPVDRVMVQVDQRYGWVLAMYGRK